MWKRNPSSHHSAVGFICCPEEVCDLRASFLIEGTEYSSCKIAFTYELGKLFSSPIKAVSCEKVSVTRNVTTKMDYSTL